MPVGVSLFVETGFGVFVISEMCGQCRHIPSPDALKVRPYICRTPCPHFDGNFKSCIPLIINVVQESFFLKSKKGAKMLFGKSIFKALGSKEMMRLLL